MKDIKLKKKGKKLIVVLKNGKKMEFRRTDKIGKEWRYDSRDFAFESYKNDLHKRSEEFIDSLPDDLVGVIVPTKRAIVDSFGIEKEVEAKIFVTDASEIFPTKRETEFFSHPYKQMRYYESARNRIRLGDDGEPKCYWTASACRDVLTSAVGVYYDGDAYGEYASSSMHVPICFYVNSERLLRILYADSKGDKEE